jgi:hypothetical protein
MQNFDLCSDDELRVLWKTHFKGTRKEFCLMWNINGGNFSAWMTKKRNTNPSASTAVRKYLLQYHSQQENISLVKKYSLDDFIRNYMNEIKTIMYIDGDNAATYIDSLSILLSENQRGILVVVVLSRGAVNALVLEMEQKYEWVFVHYSLTNTKDAADIALTSLAITHDIILKKQVNFVILSRDHFIIELKSQLEERGRKCHIDNGFRISPAVALLFQMGEILREYASPFALSIFDSFNNFSSKKEIKRTLTNIVKGTNSDEIEKRIAHKLLGSTN